MSAHLQGAESYWKGLIGEDDAAGGLATPSAKLQDA